ncbi:beta-ketoacyl-ACP synthase III [Niabella drilacis]|uniref:3-oxoacyl-[acyl-carrier-protein] synthase-3 n=1 Tax=Niabella drilacis (strain DSM 25811 / CCM 8410 / CCUG 62505 / LMG 26954 / E90) TaxID=1285928 RepID=A0A1G6NIL8_NIADE|nr:beta-ketoacyl-ACP synthase III [Niabella drilacis]SDC67810.1 3-oxoacyl-[acyl-carrier-protein] synthase-3 [Niabella drilacis]
MNLNDVYINRTAHYFPNNPVSNDEMEDYLGYINGKPSKSRRIVLRNNAITNRYYALEKGGKITHTNAQLTAEAIKELFKQDPGGIKNVDVLSCGTSSPDQMMPSHAVMVHGWLPELGSIEVVSPAGVCCAGMHALKYAYMSVKTGDAATAVATGSERFSASLVANQFEDEVHKLEALEENPYISFDKEFLRWMLSDGASAFLISNKKNEEGLSLKIEWMEGISYADHMEACMYMGAEKQEDGHLKSFLEFNHEELNEKSVLSIKQDVKLLSPNIVPLGGKLLPELFERRGLNPDDITWYLPHMSSNFFKDKIYDEHIKLGHHIPYEKWFVNLSRVGNVGAASVYFMVDELFNSGQLKKGDKVFLLVPESSRFSYMYALLTVV